MQPDLFLRPEYYQKTREKVEEAHTLPPAVYHDEQFFAFEATHLFKKAWVLAGYTSQVCEPGQVFITEVAGQPLIIAKNHQGTLQAFYNVCRHRGSILIETPGKYARFRCPYHSWTYDLNGTLIACPLFDTHASSFTKENYGLLPVRVETWGCFIFVNLDATAEPLSDYLGDVTRTYQNFPLHELVLVRRKSYDIEANWKLVAENFLEYYHLPWVHPELTEVTAIEMHKRNQGAGMYMSFYAHPLQKSGSALDSDYLPAMPKLNAVERDAGYFPFVFPNLATFLLPHHLFVLMMQPASAHKTKEYGDLLVHKSLVQEPGYQQKIDEIFAFYDMVNLQDIKAVERVQQGIKVSAYPGGRLCYRFEEPVHRFQNMVIDFMTSDRRVYQGDLDAY